MKAFIDQYYIIMAILSFIITGIAIIRNIRSIETFLHLALTFIPYLGPVLGVISLIQIIGRSIKTKGACIFGHSFEEIPQRYRGSICGGTVNFSCKKCLKKDSYDWTAF